MKMRLLVCSIVICLSVVAVCLLVSLSGREYPSDVRRLSARKESGQSGLVPADDNQARDAETNATDGVGRALYVLSDEIYQEAHVMLSQVAQQAKAESLQAKADRATEERYQDLVRQSQVIRGTLKLPQPGGNGLPFQMSIRSVKTTIPVVVSHGNFASPKLAPDVYKLVLYETEKTPGMRFENIEVELNMPLEPLVIEPQNSSIKLWVVDPHGQPVGGAYTTVCKAAGTGVDHNLVTFKTGHSNRDGLFLASGLADGTYVVSAKKDDRQVRRPIMLRREHALEYELKLAVAEAKVAGGP